MGRWENPRADGSWRCVMVACLSYNSIYSKSGKIHHVYSFKDRLILVELKLIILSRTHDNSNELLAKSLWPGKYGWILSVYVQKYFGDWYLHWSIACARQYTVQKTMWNIFGCCFNPLDTFLFSIFWIPFLQQHNGYMDERIFIKFSGCVEYDTRNN